jgi:hypothetical protein
VSRVTAAMKSTADAVAAGGARVGDRFAPALISLTLDEVTRRIRCAPHGRRCRQHSRCNAQFGSGPPAVCVLSTAIGPERSSALDNQGTLARPDARNVAPGLTARPSADADCGRPDRPGRARWSPRRGPARAYADHPYTYARLLSGGNRGCSTRRRAHIASAAFRAAKRSSRHKGCGGGRVRRRVPAAATGHFCPALARRAGPAATGAEPLERDLGRGHRGTVDRCTDSPGE